MINAACSFVLVTTNVNINGYETDLPSESC